MAAPDTAAPLTDDDLRAIATKGDPNDVDLLTDDEVRRLSALTEKPTEPKEVKSSVARPVRTEQPGQVPEIQGQTIPFDLSKPFGQQNILAGLPTLQASEAAKTPPPVPQVQETPQVTLPSYGVDFSPPATPQAPLSERLSNAVSKAASTAGLPSWLEDMLYKAARPIVGTPAFDAAPESQPILPSQPETEMQPPYAGDAALSNPDVAAQQIAAQQQATLSGGTPQQAFTGSPGVMTSSDLATSATVPRLAGAVGSAMLESQVASMADFVFNPMRQLAQHPMEFGMNALQISWMANAAKGVKALNEAKTALAELSPAELRAASETLDTSLDKIDRLKDMNRTLGSHPDYGPRIRELETRIEGWKATLDSELEKAPAAPPPEPVEAPLKAGDRVKSPKGKEWVVTSIRDNRAFVKAVGDPEGPTSNFMVGSLAKVEEPGPVSDATTAATQFPIVLSAAPAGAMLLAGANRDDKTDPTPRAQSPLSWKNYLWNNAGALGVGLGIFGYGVARYFTSPEFRQALLEFTQLSKASPPDLEKVMKTLVLPMIPDVPGGTWADRPISGLQAKAVGGGAILGAAAGGVVGSKLGRDESSPVSGAAGAAMGAIMGAYTGNTMKSLFATPMTMRQLYDIFLTEAAGRSPSAVEFKRVSVAALEGRVRELGDVSRKTLELSGPEREAAQNWMAGNINIDAVPEKARFVAAQGRLLFDELTLDLLSSGLIHNDVLRNTMTSNLGTYLPRLLLRYELKDEARERVESWLAGQGKGWGYIGSQDYLKAKTDVPSEVLEALGEIKDNPGYLLAKRGVMTAADIETARYHRLLMSTPENVIPESVRDEGLKALRSYGRLLKEDSAAVKADRLLKLQEVGEIPEVNYAPQIAQEQQRAAEARIGETTIKRSYDYLDPQTSLPRFFSSGNTKMASWQGRTYWQMPDTARYGLLRGQFVEQAVASDIKSMYDTSALSTLWRAPLSVFKYFKAVMNPASLFRQGFSHGVLMDLNADIPPWRMDLYWKAVSDVHSESSAYYAARSAGAFGGDFPVREIQSMLDPIIGQSEGFMDMLGRTSTNKALESAKTAGYVRQWMNVVQRQTVFNKGIEMGMSESAAAMFARQTVPDYLDVPRWIKVLRSSPFGAPFCSFAYKSIPLTLKSAFAFGNPKQLFRFWKYPMVMAGLNEYAAQTQGLMSDGQDEDLFSTVRRVGLRALSSGMAEGDWKGSYDITKKFLPSGVGHMQLALPWTDHYDRVNHTDMTFLLPWGSASMMGVGEFSKGTGLPLPRDFEPSSPYVQMMVAASTGKNSFTGSDIIPKGTPPGGTWPYWSAFLMQAWGPALGPNGYSANSLQRSFSGDYDANPNVKTPGEAVMSDLIGLRTRSVDPGRGFVTAYSQFKSDLDENTKAIHRADRTLAGMDDFSPTKIKEVLSSHPSAELSHLFQYRQNLLDQFNQAYPPEERPRYKTPKAMLEWQRKQAAKGKTQ